MLTGLKFKCLQFTHMMQFNRNAVQYFKLFGQQRAIISPLSIYEFVLLSENLLCSL